MSGQTSLGRREGEKRPSIATERHYTPQEVAAIWNVSVSP